MWIITNHVCQNIITFIKSQHVTYTEGNKPTLWSKGSIEKRLQDRKQNHYPGMSSLLVTDLLKAVYPTEKFGSGPVKKAVRTHNFCKETLEFPQGHEGRFIRSATGP